MRRNRTDGTEPVIVRRAVLPDKARMQEARLELCPECGSQGGHHLRVCSRGGAGLRGRTAPSSERAG
jgi:hypothetical protein